MQQRNTILIGLLGCVGAIVMVACFGGALFAAYSFGREAATPIATQPETPTAPPITIIEAD